MTSLLKNSLKVSLEAAVRPPPRDQVMAERKAAVVHVGPSLALSFWVTEASCSASCTMVSIKGNSDLQGWRREFWICLSKSMSTLVSGKFGATD